MIRQSKGDQHVHLCVISSFYDVLNELNTVFSISCIYMIDPASVMTASARRALSGLPIKTRSETTISPRNPPELIPDTSSGDDSDDEVKEELTMSAAEIRVLRRLAERINILPVIARADSLTDERVHAVKAAVRRSLSGAGLGFGVFDETSQSSASDVRASMDTASTSAADEEESEDDRQSRPVIKLRMPRMGRKSSHSRSHRDLSQVAEDPRRPVSPDTTDPDTVANVRFSAQAVAKADLKSLMPFALIAPESNIHRHRQLSNASQASSPRSACETPVDGPDLSVPPTPVSTTGSKHTSYYQGPPEDLKDQFVRKFRWGTIDVLNPTHCDFAALRTVVLSTHMKVRFGLDLVK